MTLHTFLLAIQDLPLAGAVRGDFPELTWMFPIVETLHVFALAVVFGSIAIVDMRLLGWRSLNSPVSKLAGGTLPVTWIAWSCAAVTGALMFLAKAVTYAGNLQFQLKFVMMALAAANMLVFHYGSFRKVATWDTVRPPPTAARVAGALSLALWTAVIFFGRWMGFTT